MPKLRAMHYSRVGHPEARLDGLSINYTDLTTNEPSETIKWLRNGGGKTSQVQLLFSLFVPNRRDFIGKTKASGNRTFNDYFIPGEVGLIVGEWDLGKDAPIRVIGQCVQRKSHDDPKPDRTFFSFLIPRNGTGVPITALPMRQFESESTPGNMASCPAFFAYVKNLFQNRPDLDFFDTKDQGEWVEKLAGWGFDPDLYRLMAQMNKKESDGQTMLDQINTTEKMIELIAGLMTTPTGLKSLQELLNNHREKLRELPALEVEKKFLAELHALLVELIEPGKSLVDSITEVERAISQQINTGKDIVATEPIISGRLEELKNKKTTLDQEQQKTVDQVATLEGEKRWLNLELAVIDEQTCNKALGQATIAVTEAEQTKKRLEAAGLSLDIQETQGQCRGLEQTIAEASKPVEALFKTLNGLGAALSRHYSDKVESIQQSEKTLKDNKEGVRLKQEQASKEKDRAGDLIGQTKAHITHLTDWLEEACRSHRSLILNGHLANEEETGESALKRIKKELKELDLHLGKMAAEKTTVGEALSRNEILVGKATAQQEGLNEQLAELNQELQAFQESLEGISADNAICDLLEQDSFDPYFPGLKLRLDRKIETLQRSAAAMTFDLRREEETLACLEGEYGLMPPQEDVLRVVEALQAEGITSTPYVRFLAENRFAPEKIRSLMKIDPARYGGVYLLASKDLAEVPKVASTLPSLRGPVQVSIDCELSQDDSNHSDSAVILPTTDATFDRTAAAEQKRETQKRADGLKANIESNEEQARSLEKAKEVLIGFLGRFPELTKEKIQTELTTTQNKLDDIEQTIAEAKQEITSCTGRLQALEEELNTTQEDKKKKEAAKERVFNYVTDIETPLPEKKGTLKAMEKQLEEAEEKRRTFSSRCLELAEEERRLADQLIRLENTLKGVRKEAGEVAYTNQDAGTLSAETDPEDFETVKAMYGETLKTYSKETVSTDGLRTKLQMLKTSLEKQKTQYQLRYADISESEVTETLTSHPEGIDDVELEKATQLISARNEEKGSAKHQAGLAQQLVKKLSADMTSLVAPKHMPAQPSKKDLQLILSAKENEKNRLAATLNASRQAIAELLQNISEQEKQLAVLESLIQTVHANLKLDIAELVSSGLESVEQCQDLWNEATKHLSSAENRKITLEKKVNQIKNQVGSLINKDEYQHVLPILRRRIGEARPLIHQEAERFSSDTSERLATIEATYASLNDNKMEIVGYLYDYVTSTALNLNNLTKLSGIPENNGAWSSWSGEPFLKVTINQKKLKDGYGITSLEKYVDSLIRASELPSADQIVLGAATAALRNLTKISTLKPDFFASKRPYTLEEIDGFSGGEKLMFTILAFMVFARLTSLVSGTKTKGGHLLILDNPIGECNLTSFIKLQRMTAKMLDVQLVYATGIKDIEVVSMFKNVVSLKNERRDKNTGFKHVETETFNRDMAGVNQVAYLGVNEDLTDPPQQQDSWDNDLPREGTA